MKNSFHRTIYLDIETAGLDLEDPIIEVAAVAVESTTYHVVDSIDMKLAFETKHLSNFTALGINKFSAQKWEKYALPSDVAAKKLSLFFKRYATVEKTSRKSGKEYTIARLAGHNSNAFDAPRIKRLFDLHGLFFHPEMLRTLDTEQKARWFFADHPEIKPPANYKLSTLIEHLGIDCTPDHTALADTLATIDLAQALFEAHRLTAISQAA